MEKWLKLLQLDNLGMNISNLYFGNMHWGFVLRVVEKYTNPYSQLIQELNKAGHTSFSKDFLEAQLLNEGLYLGKRAERGTTDKSDEIKQTNPFSLIQNGHGNTQIGYVGQQVVNINYSSFGVDYMPQMIDTR